VTSRCGAICPHKETAANKNTVNILPIGLAPPEYHRGLEWPPEHIQKHSLRRIEETPHGPRTFTQPLIVPVNLFPGGHQFLWTTQNTFKDRPDTDWVILCCDAPNILFGPNPRIHCVQRSVDIRTDQFAIIENNCIELDNDRCCASNSLSRERADALTASVSGRATAVRRLMTSKTAFTGQIKRA
jgi:hypothetical protein